SESIGFVLANLFIEDFTAKRQFKIMESEHWEQVKNLFEQALAIAPNKRPKFLKEACSEREIIRHEVEELLRSFDDSAGFLETPAISKKKNEIIGGQQLNQYEIIESIGAGGMGEVFLALD